MPWQPGESGNPRGRPQKGTTLTELLRETAECMTQGGLARKQALVNKIWEMAENGDLAAARLILEYVDGKPVERIEAAIGPRVHFTADDAAQAAVELRAWEAAHPAPELED